MSTITRRTALKTAIATALAAPAIWPAGAQTRTVKIGVLTDQSGVYADLAGAGSVLAAQMAAEDFGGQVRGMPIEIVAADHQNRPDVGLNIARTWFDREGVSMICDIPGSAIALGVAELARDKNKVFVASSAATSDLTGRACTPNTVHWTFDNWSLANGTGRAVVESGGQSWFFITADYAFGHDLEAQVAAVVRGAGGQVLGSARHPLGNADFSSYLLQAQRSRAAVIGLANGGGDTINTIKQAAEFGIVQRGQKLVGLLIALTDIHALGLAAAQGLQFTEAFYWNLNAETRAWSLRFAPRRANRMPTQGQAGVYGGVLHYLKGVREAAGADDGAAVVRAMKALPTEDPLFGRGTIRADGRKLHDIYLFEAKTPAESREPWDYYKIVRTIPAASAFRPIAEGNCAIAR